MKKFTLMLFCILTLQFAMAQQGKDGVANIITTNTVNIYTPLIANAAAGTTSITVASTAGLSAGDLIYIIQVQGATVRDTVYQYGNTNNSLPNDTSFGKIRAYNGAGNNEFVEITSISGNIITIDCALKNSYNDTIYPHPGNTQIVRVPRYISLTLSAAGLITCPPWDGHTGGVVAIEVQGNTTIGAGTSINVTGMGFRGGSALVASGFGATNTGSAYIGSGTNNGAHKGESIAGDTNVYKKINYISGYSLSTPLTTCKGNVANGGGGGNANNCGGGGGSNGGVIANWNGMGNADVSTPNNIAAWNQEPAVPLNGSFRPTTSPGGGRGGYAYSDNNSDPTTTAPGNTVWVGDNRHNDGGWGGIPLDYSTGKIFLGGGGGAGDSNDGNGTDGGNGGGIVYLLSYGTVTGTGQIIADGAIALNTNTAPGIGKHGDDGAGGAGGGGAVFINSTGNIANTLTLSAQGGVGGSFIAKPGITFNANFGPGGGGGGGYVATTNAIASIKVNGGANGIVVQNASNNTKIATKFPPNGATAGGAGTSSTALTPNFYLTATNYTTCVSGALSLSVTVNGTTPPGLSVMWYTVSAGGTPVFTGNPYAITAPAVAGTYTYYAGTCPGIYRIPIIVTVTSASGPVLSVSATSTTTCAGSNDTLHVSGATSYTWSANAGSVTTSTALINPISTTVYTVTGSSSGGCAGTSTASISITVNPTPTITITPATSTLCIGTSTTLTASGATTYSWIPGTGLSSTTTSVVVANPTVTTTYTITGTSASGCVGTNTITIHINPTPTITVNSPSVCGGGSTTVTANGAVNYTWTPATGLSATTGSVVTATPSVTTNYTVTGTDANGCSSSATSTVTITSNPAVVVNSATICVGNSAMLTASGASTYTWSPATGLSATTGTMVMASPSVTTTYTVAGSVGTCTATPGTTTITVNPTPTITVNSPAAICSGLSTTLTANGASTYSWTSGIGLSSTTGSSVTATPSVTTSYTVTGTNVASCTNTAVTTVVVNPTPTVTVNSATVCAGDPATLTASGAASYAWFPSTGLSATTGSLVMAAPSVTTSYLVDGTTGICSGIATATVTVITNPVITANSATYCASGSATLTATGATSYTWSPATGLSSTHGSTVTATPTITTTYTITGMIGTCAAAPYTTTVTVNPLPIVTVSSSTAICSGTSATLTANGTSTYSWIPGASLSASSGSPITATPSVTTSYTVMGTDVNSCTNTAITTVSVNPTPTFTLNPSATSICIGNSTTLTATGTATSYSWTPATGLSASSGSVVTANPVITTTYIVVGTIGSCSYKDSTTITVIPVSTITVTPKTNTVCAGGSSLLAATGATSYTWTPAVSLSSANNSTVTATPLATTIYTVTGMNGICPANSATAMITVNPLPTVSVTPTATACTGASATLTASGTGTTGLTYIWFPATGLSAATGSTVIANPSSATIYTVIATDANGCTTVAFSAVNTPTLQANFVPTPDAGSAPLSVHFINNSLNATNYVWTFGNGSNQTTTTLTDTAHTVYNNAGTYTVVLTASNAFGCVSSETLTVIVKESFAITIPNVFSPNGDGINDVFDVKAMGITSLNCDIFDRWGLKLYSFNSAAGYWDGSSKGGKEIDGTYFYVIQATDTKGDNHKYNGFITLIR